MATFDIDVQHICVDFVAVCVQHEVVFAVATNVHGFHTAETDCDEGVLNAVLCVTSKMGQHRGTEHCYLCNRQDGAGVLNVVLCVRGTMGQGY